MLTTNPFATLLLATAGLSGMRVHPEKVRRIRESVGTLVVGPNATFPWLLDEIEPLTDAPLIGFDPGWDAIVDANFGASSPSGRLPITFAISAEALAHDHRPDAPAPTRVHAGCRSSAATWVHHTSAMTRRPDNERLRRLILGTFLVVLALDAVLLLFAIAPMSNDPEGVGRLLGGIAGFFGATGMLMVLVGFMTPRRPRDDRR